MHFIREILGSSHYLADKVHSGCTAGNLFSNGVKMRGGGASVATEVTTLAVLGGVHIFYMVAGMLRMSPRDGTSSFPVNCGGMLVSVSFAGKHMTVLLIDFQREEGVRLMSELRFVA